MFSPQNENHFPSKTGTARRPLHCQAAILPPSSPFVTCRRRRLNTGFLPTRHHLVRHHLVRPQVRLILLYFQYQREQVSDSSNRGLQSKYNLRSEQNLQHFDNDSDLVTSVCITPSRPRMHYYISSLHI